MSYKPIITFMKIGTSGSYGYVQPFKRYYFHINKNKKFKKLIKVYLSYYYYLDILYNYKIRNGKNINFNLTLLMFTMSEIALIAKFTVACIIIYFIF